jgi:predicted Zn-dependent peptidase
MSLLINCLGGPALNSRLNLSIREKYGYAYNVEANYTPYLDTGFWSVYIGSEQKYSHRTIELVYKELKKMCDQQFGVLQLSRAKEQLKGHLALGMDSNSGLMLGLGKSLLLMNTIDTIEAIHDGIDALTAEQLIETANRYLDPSMCSILTFDLAENKD